MTCKSSNRNEIDLICERPVARGAARCASRRIRATIENIKCREVSSLDKIRKIGKLEKQGKKNKIWSIGKLVADLDTPYHGNFTCLSVDGR